MLVVVIVVGVLLSWILEWKQMQVADLEPCVQSLACRLHVVSMLLKLCWPLHPPLKQQIKQLLSAFLHISRLAELHAVHETEQTSVDVRAACVVAAGQGYVGRHVGRHVDTHVCIML